MQPKGGIVLGFLQLKIPARRSNFFGILTYLKMQSKGGKVSGFSLLKIPARRSNILGF